MKETRNAPITDPSEIRRLITQHGRWWHEIEVAPGIITPGDDSNRMKLPILEELGLAPDLTGLRALDIGCSDGYFSFELEKRGANVIAVDFVPPDYTGFSVASRILGSSVEYRMDNVYNIAPDRYGEFDIVFLMGVLYHLRKPLAALDALRSVMKEGGQLFVGTMMIDEYFLLPDGTVTTLEAVNPILKSVPLWQAFPGDSLNGDYTNCFAPNLAALKTALSESQFHCEATRSVAMGGYARATAVVDAMAGKYQRLDGRLESSPFDPTVPYFLDEAGSVQTVTPRKNKELREPEPGESKRPWWKWRG